MSKRIVVWVQKFNDRPALMLRWTDPTTNKVRSKSSGTNDAVAAEKASADLEYELNHGLHKEPNKMPWDRFRDLYETEKLVGDREATQRKAANIFDRFEKLMNPRTIGGVTERTISQYAAQLLAKGLKKPTIQGHLSYLKAALRWAWRQKFITEVPTIIMPKIPKGANKAKVRAAAKISGEAFERLLMKCPNDGWRLFLSLCWHCGLRRSEARRVRGCDIDLAAGTIAIPVNKAGDESATVDIPYDLEDMLLARWPDGRRPEDGAKPDGQYLPEGNLITSAEVQVSTSAVSRLFKKIATHAGVKGGGKDGLVTLHDLRRAFGSRWASRAPAQVLKRMMRHSDIKTTLEFYADVEEAAHNLVRPPRATPEPELTTV